MMARGEKYGTIQRILLDEHGIEYTSKSLSLLRKEHRETIKEMELMILDNQTHEAAQTHDKLLRALNRKIDQATEDELEIQRLDEEYRNGDLTLVEYRQQKTGLLKISAKDLSQMAKDIYTQIDKKRNPSGTLPSGTLPIGSGSGEQADPKWVEALTTAIQRGDTVTMQQLIVEPNSD